MRRTVAAVVLVAGMACGGCGASPGMPPASAAVTAPTASGGTTSGAAASVSAATGGPCTIGFGSMPSSGPFGPYHECGLTVTPQASNWNPVMTYGAPAPFIEFMSAAGETSVGTVELTADGAPFGFGSIDLYSSTTTIPYVIVGRAGGSVVFDLEGTQGHTFGDFATIGNPTPARSVTSLTITLTNPAAACCRNPVGLDNIRVVF